MHFTRFLVLNDMYIYEVPQVTEELVFFPSVVNHRVRFILT